VRVRFAPINPADINVLEGKYPIRPTLPGTPGVEGVGVVEEVGVGVSNFSAGATVLLPHGFGTWREAGNVPAADLVPVPVSVPLEQAAMLRINPATALLLMREFVDLQPGEWIIQNAANSAVGRCVIRLARHFGWRTVNVVRRAELVEELQSKGADVVLVDGEQIGAELKAATGGAPLRLALNAVGGESAVRLGSALAPGGVVVTYGAMARQPLRIPNGLLIFQDIAWRGFWVSRWYRNAAAGDAAAVLAELCALAASGVIATPVEAVYPLEEIAGAIEHAQRSGRSGKVILRCS
jgi:mitochondrial enoyl-[acyl-carrier protein] reductase / trans-2-enoyl-CoA reductase